MLSSADAAIKINPNIEINMGTLFLEWKNYFGDPGSLKIGPYKTQTKSAKDASAIEVSPIDSQILLLEEPSMQKFRLSNLTE